ncbi:MAG: ATP-binding protein [Pseudomonadota bacterium]
MSTAKLAKIDQTTSRQARKRPPKLGRVVSINGAHALIALDPSAIEAPREQRPHMGAIMSIDAGEHIVLGLTSAMTSGPDGASPLVELELVGEFTKPTASAPGRFRRGVSSFPALGDSAHLASVDELSALFMANGGASVRVGVVKQEDSIPASVSVNELFSRHCAILGTTGAGKSCAVTLMLSSVLRRYAHGHVVIVDVHNEYANCFGDKAIVFDSSNLTLPFWMLTFEEFTEILYPGRRDCEEEIEILLEIIPSARKMNIGGAAAAGSILADRRGDPNAINVDTPIPYRVSDLLTLIDRTLGGLDNTRATAPYKRLRGRLKQISTDARYSFMFGSLTVQDTMAALLGQLFRIPVEDAPVSVLELGGLPSEVSQVVVSVIARIAYEFGLWSDGAAPIALIVEDAHRFAPADPDMGFAPTRRALVRIAKEGRKTGVSLWIVSQRPTELDPMVLSQCNTIFAMRLANQADQDALKAAIPDAAMSLMSCLPSLGLGEAVAVGESLPLPTRIRFDAVPRTHVPLSLTANFTDAWSIEISDGAFLERIVDQWRAQRRLLPPA